MPLNSRNGGTEFKQELIEICSTLQLLLYREVETKARKETVSRFTSALCHRLHSTAAWLAAAFRWIPIAASHPTRRIS
jgi:hypothetical protein